MISHEASIADEYFHVTREQRSERNVVALDLRFYFSHEASFADEYFHVTREQRSKRNVVALDAIWALKLSTSLCILIVQMSSGLQLQTQASC